MVVSLESDTALAVSCSSTVSASPSIGGDTKREQVAMNIEKGLKRSKKPAKAANFSIPMLMPKSQGQCKDEDKQKLCFKNSLTHFPRVAYRIWAAIWLARCCQITREVLIMTNYLCKYRLLSLASSNRRLNRPLSLEWMTSHWNLGYLEMMPE